MCDCVCDDGIGRLNEGEERESTNLINGWDLREVKLPHTVS